ncbi:MAG TPA: enoyl-CoA hydratase/isomerase family protein [Kofleriaceae bacterium]|nr:enoyl-CoA hydratase/isomerase family protein [Kofleriaceae bacterium]
MPTTDAVQYLARGAIGVLTLNRPDNRNSMTPELLDAFAAASVAARADTRIRCLIVTGTGTCFSSGADFKATLQREGGEPHERSYAMYAPFLSLLDIEVPIIGALNGHTVGGGFGLALLCDLRIGNLAAKYGANFARLGLAPGMAISYMLPRIVGLSRANELLLTGRLIEGDEAARIGLLDRAVDAADVMTVALELATTIAANAPFAVRATKAAIRRGLALDIRDAARAEAVVQAQSIAMDDAREGIAALLAKRAPVFTGR